MSNHGALTRMLNGNGNIRRAVSDKTVRGGGERARVHHFPAGQGGERFCSLSQPNPKQYKAGVNNNKKLYLHFNIQFGFNQKLSQNVTTLELY